MKGMVIIDSSHYGKSMEIVECLKEKVMDLIDTLSYAEMGEKSYDKYDDEDYFGERNSRARKMPRGRFNY